MVRPQPRFQFLWSAQHVVLTWASVCTHQWQIDTATKQKWLHLSNILCYKEAIQIGSHIHSAAQLLTTERNLLSSPLPSTWHTVRTDHRLKKTQLRKKNARYVTSETPMSTVCGDFSGNTGIFLTSTFSFIHYVSQPLQDQCVKCLKGCRSSNRMELALKGCSIKVGMCSLWS